jgi:hypothetical protein
MSFGHALGRAGTLLLLVLLVGCGSILDSADDQDAPKARASRTEPTPNTPLFLATMAPYVPPAADLGAEEAPSGYRAIFTEGVSRHGSRALTSDDSIKDAIDLWQEAKANGALTSAGKGFGPAAMTLFRAMNSVGFGELTALGKQEQKSIGLRVGQRLSTLFEAAAAEGEKVDVIDSGKNRAEASGASFVEGLTLAHPTLEVEPSETDKNLLKFDAEDRGYERFLDGNAWHSAYSQVVKNANIDAVSARVLRHLYTSEFVASIDNQFSEANAVFDAYRSAPGLERDVNVDMTPYMQPETAEAFAYLDDGRFFYTRGPGVVGDDRSYIASTVLLKDFFKAIDDHVLGRGNHTHAAVYRFAHAEEITPFAALLELPGSDEQALAGEIYTHDNNDFRVDRVASMSANIEWTVWQKGSTHIVGIRYNEVPTAIGRGCKPFRATKTFYKLTELKHCLTFPDQR